MNLKEKKVFIWGGLIRGKQVKGILKQYGIKVAGVIDDKNELFINPEEFFREYNSKDDVIIIASMYKREIDAILSKISNNDFKGLTINNCEFHHMYEIPYFSSCANRKYEIDFKSKMKRWFDNYLSEVKFWKEDVARPNSHYWNHYNDRIRPKEFFCDRIKMDKLLTDAVILDVGCGVCSQYGSYLKGEKINLYGIDPLASFYNKINEAYCAEFLSGKEYPEVRFGMFELLSFMMGENYADVILIDNALDHCIDPIASLVECLKVLKKDGVLSTNHHIDEAYKAYYSDLHQWNVCCDQEDNFILWNRENYINVVEYLSGYVEVETKIIKDYTDEEPYGRVICNFRKIKDIPDTLCKDMRERCGMVMKEMMEKLADKTYAELLMGVFKD